MNEHVHQWTHKQNVTTRGYVMSPYEACFCGAARDVTRPAPADAPDGDRDALAKVIAAHVTRETESGDYCDCPISGPNEKDAEHGADAILASDWLAARLDRERRDVAERIAQAIREASFPSLLDGSTARFASMGAIERIARQEADR